MKSTVLVLPAFSNRVRNLADLSTRCSGLHFALKKTGASGRNVGKVSNPVAKSR